MSLEWTAERNPDREYNFRIRELGAGRFAVVSDSERFGADQVVFESFRRGECVDYVTQRRDPGKWNYYVIEDLSSWIRGSENPNPLERFDRFDQAKQRFCELRDRQENDDITDKPHLTMGVGWVGGLDLDVLHVRHGKNVLCDDFTRSSFTNTNCVALAMIEKTVKEIGVDAVRIFPQNHGNLMKPTDIPLRLWRNPYFHSERLRIADRLKAKRDTMTATKRKDIQER